MKSNLQSKVNLVRSTCKKNCEAMVDREGQITAAGHGFPESVKTSWNNGGCGSVTATNYERLSMLPRNKNQTADFNLPLPWYYLYSTCKRGSFLEPSNVNRRTRRLLQTTMLLASLWRGCWKIDQIYAWPIFFHKLTPCTSNTRTEAKR